MTIEELKDFFSQATLQDEVQILPHFKVLDAKKFIDVQFKQMESWVKDLSKCPAYVHLMEYKNYLENYK